MDPVGCKIASELLVWASWILDLVSHPILNIDFFSIFNIGWDILDLGSWILPDIEAFQYSIWGGFTITTMGDLYIFT